MRVRKPRIIALFLLSVFAVLLFTGCELMLAVLFLSTLEDDGEITYELPRRGKWFFDTGKAVTGTPALGEDGTIYIGSEDSVFAINPDGTERWRFQTDGGAGTTVAVGGDGTIYASTQAGSLYALTPDGSQQWVHESEGLVRTGPALGPDGIIYTILVNVLEDSEEIRYFAFLQAVAPTGREQWQISLGRMDRVEDIYLRPAIASDGTVYVAVANTDSDSRTATLYALTPEGELQWTAPVGSGWPTHPVVDVDGTVYVATSQGVAALAPDGEQKWWYPYATSGKSGIVIDESGKIHVAGGFEYITFFLPYPAGSEGRILRFDRAGTLEAMYAEETPESQNTDAEVNIITSTPAIGANGVLYVGDNPWAGDAGPGSLFAISPDHTILWQVDVYKDIVGSPVIAPDGTIYLGCSGGLLYAMASESGGPASDAPWPLYGHDARHTGHQPLFEEVESTP